MEIDEWVPSCVSESSGRGRGDFKDNPHRGGSLIVDQIVVLPHLI
jgi:hypothetical protein